MKSPLFSPRGWIFLPHSFFGYVLCALAGLFCTTVFLAVDRHSHSSSDTLYGVFPYVGTTFLLLDWVARRSYEKSVRAAQS